MAIAWSLCMLMSDAAPKGALRSTRGICVCAAAGNSAEPSIRPRRRPIAQALVCATLRILHRVCASTVRQRQHTPAFSCTKFCLELRLLQEHKSWQNAPGLAVVHGRAVPRPGRGGHGQLHMLRSLYIFLCRALCNNMSLNNS